jgi:hypothetical protein
MKRELVILRRYGRNIKPSPLLGIFPKLGVSFKTTNCIENIMRNVIKVVCEALFNFN